MSKTMSDKPADATGRVAMKGASPGVTLVGTPDRRASKRRRVILMAGGVVAMLAAAGIVTIVALPFAAPRAPAISEIRSFVQSGLPEGRAVQPVPPVAVPPVPPVSHDLGFHERVAALGAAVASTEQASNVRPNPEPAYANWPETRTDIAVNRPDLPAMRPVPGAVDGRGGDVRSAESAAVPSMPAGMGSWDAASPNNPANVAPSQSASPETSQSTAPKTVANSRPPEGAGGQAGRDLRYTGQPIAEDPPAATDRPLEFYRYSGAPTPVPAGSPTWDPACGAPTGGDPGCQAG